MKKSGPQFIMSIPLALLLFFAFSCQQQGDVEADIEAIKATLKSYEAVSNAGDLDGWLSLWDDDGVRMPPNAPSRSGAAQMTQEMKPIFELFDADIRITSIEEVKIFGDIGISMTSYTLSATPKAGGDKIIVEPDGKALTIWKRQVDGSWKIYRDCFNSNVPPPSES